MVFPTKKTVRNWRRGVQAALRDNIIKSKLFEIGDPGVTVVFDETLTGTHKETFF